MTTILVKLVDKPYSNPYWLMFLIGQITKHVHITFFFLELLIFFWLTLVNINCLEFISHYIKGILYIHSNFKRKPIIKETERDIDFHLPLILMLKSHIFFRIKLKFRISNFWVFSVSWTNFLKLIKQPFRRGLILINVIIIFSSQHILETSFDV